MSKSFKSKENIYKKEESDARSTGVQLSCMYQPSYKACSHILWLYNPICVRPSRKPLNSFYILAHVYFCYFWHIR